MGSGFYADGEPYEFEYVDGSLASDYECEVNYVDRKLSVRFDTAFSTPEIEFEYVVRLVNPRMVGGVYGIFDADGSLGKDGLLVSNGASYAGMNFASPTVSYEIVEPVPTGVDFEVVSFVIGAVIVIGGMH